jgi:hypothetical protein
MKAWHIRTLSVLLLLAAAAALSAALLPAARADEAGKPAVWAPLFNGKDTEGWKAQGSAVFKVEDGCLLGTQTDGKGGDLFTTAEYDNFELRFTYKVGWPANSGVWFRTDYQYDILKYKNPVAFSGSLYCSAKMFLTRNENEKLEDRDGWNEGQVYANGDHVILWLNGVKTGDCHDATFKKGKVGLQVHPGDEFKGMKIIVKNIEIRPLAADEPATVPTPPASQPAK